MMQKKLEASSGSVMANCTRVCPEADPMEEKLKGFELRLKEEEKSTATIEKYMRDVKKFLDFSKDEPEISRKILLSYKEYLSEKYAATSANSMLASLNHYLCYADMPEYKLRSFKFQRELCRRQEQNLSREEYLRLLETAKKRNQEWLYLAMLTICSTGIRVSELEDITVESLHTRKACVRLKGKSRIVILPVILCRELKKYVHERGIQNGSIFVTRNGKPMDRSNILHGMKKLCLDAEVDPKKTFPHNLRHLFAVTYYEKEHNLPNLADILGHSNINTTRIYTLVSIEEQERRIEELGLLPLGKKTLHNPRDWTKK